MPKMGPPCGVQALTIDHRTCSILSFFLIGWRFRLSHEMSVATLGNLPKQRHSPHKNSRVQLPLRSPRNGAAPRRIKERCLHVFFLAVVDWNGCRRTEKPIQLATPIAGGWHCPYPHRSCRRSSANISSNMS